MELHELMKIACVDSVMVITTDKDGHETKEAKLVVLPSQFDKYGNDSVVRIEAELNTSSPSSADGSISVKPCLQAWVLHQEE